MLGELQLVSCCLVGISSLREESSDSLFFGVPLLDLPYEIKLLMIVES
jgi:hypothetical protein